MTLLNVTMWLVNEKEGSFIFKTEVLLQRTPAGSQVFWVRFLP